MTRLGQAPVVHPGAHLEAVELGRFVEIGERTRISHSSLGDYSYVMEDCQLLFTALGKFCSVASNVRINPPNHPTWRATQHHFTYRAGDYFEGAEAEAAIFDWRRANSVRIGHDVWIGHGAIILPSVEVGDGAVIAAGAVVSRSVAPYQIVGGVPAKPIKERLPPNLAGRMRALAWWDWDHGAIGAALADFRALSAGDFLVKYEAHTR